MIPHSKPELGEEEAAAAASCVLSRFVKGGSARRELELHIAHDLGYVGAVATGTGSQAIQLVLRCIGLEPGAKVCLPSYICRSVHDAVVLAGCTPTVVDIDPDTFSISLQEAQHSGARVAIVPHMFGIRAPVEAFMQAGFVVVDDSAGRVAPFDEGRNEPRAPFRILSFEATKLMTCGEGGLLLADDERVLERARLMRDAAYELTGPAVPVPLTDLQASVAAVQWRRWPEFAERRRVLAARYLKEIDDAHIVTAMRRSDTYHFRFLLQTRNPDTLIAHAARHGVSCRRPVAPKALHRLFAIKGSFERTDQAFARLVSIPIYPGLTDEDAGRVIAAVEEALSCAE